jgi:hypothetical protein
MGQAGECLGGGSGGEEAPSELPGGESASDDIFASGGGAGGEAGAEGASGGAGGSGSADGAEGSVAGTGGAGSAGEFPDESADERAARLGKELDESIGGFDEVLMEEQREVASVGRNTEGFGDGAGGGSSGGGGGISLGQQAAGAGGSNNSSGGAAGGGERASPTAGMTQEEIEERTPDDVAVMVDDDIIARQLREAALTEEDPALRERLWEEYRKYKGL